MKATQLPGYPEQEEAAVVGAWWWYSTEAAQRAGIFLIIPSSGRKTFGDGVIIMVPGPTDTDHPRPARWTITGDGDTITAHPSILVHPHGDDPGWHGFLTNGELRSC